MAQRDFPMHDERYALPAEALAGALNEAVCLVDAQGVVRSCNADWAALTGRPAQAFVQRPWAEVAAELWPGEGQGVWQQLLALPQAELRSWSHEGRKLRLEARPLFGADGCRAGTAFWLEEEAAREGAGTLAAPGAHLDSEMAKSEQYARIGPVLPVTAQLYGSSRLREYARGKYEELVARYGAILEKAVEAREYIVDHPVSEDLRVLGEELGYLGAGPRDVMELHNEMLRLKRAGAALEKARVYVEEGRFLVLELMGHLATYYRKYVFGAARATAPERAAQRSAGENPHG
jgi:hypothetical protein